MTERPIIFDGDSVRANRAGLKSQTRRIVKPQPLPEYADSTLWYPDRYNGTEDWCFWGRKGTPVQNVCGNPFFRCPYGKPGDWLWVREAWRVVRWTEGEPLLIEFRDGSRMEECSDDEPNYDAWYERMCADCSDDCRKAGLQIGDNDLYDLQGKDVPTRWRSPIFMPRWASRDRYQILSVRIERLQEISEADCWAEGIEGSMHSFDDVAQCHMANRLGCCIEDAKPLYAQRWQGIHGDGSWEANPFVWVIEYETGGSDGR